MAITYRIYLRFRNQSVSNKTTTSDKTAALAAFTTLVNRHDLDGSEVSAILNYNNGQKIACHNFQVQPDGEPGANYWRGRLDAIIWPSGEKVD